MRGAWAFALAAFLSALPLAGCLKSVGADDGVPKENYVCREASGVDGVWLMFDRSNKNEPESVVAVYERGGKRFFRMLAIYHNGKIDDTIEKPVERAKGIAGNPPLCGMDFVWDLTPAADGKLAGRVINPDDGRVYKCKVWYEASKGRLVLRGELLIFGESEYLAPFDETRLPFKIDVSKFSPKAPK